MFNKHQVSGLLSTYFWPRSCLLPCSFKTLIIGFMLPCCSYAPPRTNIGYQIYQSTGIAFTLPSLSLARGFIFTQKKYSHTVPTHSWSLGFYFQREDAQKSKRLGKQIILIWWDIKQSLLTLLNVPACVCIVNLLTTTFEILMKFYWNIVTLYCKLP